MNNSSNLKDPAGQPERKKNLSRISILLFCLTVFAVGIGLSSGLLAKGRAAIQQGTKRTGAPATRAPKRGASLPKSPKAGQSGEAQILSQSQTNADGTITPGQIVTAPPVQQSVAEIMAEQQNRPALPGPPILRPEREGPEREGLPQNPEAREGAQWPPLIKSAPVTQPEAPQMTSTQFDGATGPTETGAFPPDTMGAVGPTQFVTFLNGRVRTFNKTTGAADGVINADSDVFFAPVITPPGAGEVSFTSDPQVRFDRLSNRWFLVIIDVTLNSTTGATTRANRVLIAVSDAASNGVLSATTVWTLYQFQGDATLFTDYESLGVDASALYIGGDMFTLAGAFNSTKGFVIPKAPLLTGSAATIWAFSGLVASSSGAGPFAPRGVDNYDPANTGPTALGYFIGVDNATFGTLMIRRVTNPGSLSPAPTMSANISVLAPLTTQFPVKVPHFGNTGGTNGKLDSLDDRLYAAHLRNGRLWTAHNIGVNNTGAAQTTFANNNRNAARWYELQNLDTTPTVRQAGTLFDNAATNDANQRNYWIPSVTVSGQGHVALGCSIAGTNERVNAFTTGRLANDTLGTLQNGPGGSALPGYTNTTFAYNPPGDAGGSGGRRWGDYSFTSLDPCDDMTMWTIQEYCNGTNTYGARVVKLLAPPPATPASASPSSVAGGQASVNVTITGTSVSGSGFYDPGAGFCSHIGASVSGGVTVNSVTYTNPTSITLNLSTVGASNGTKNVTVTNPDGQSATGNGILTITGGCPTITLSPLTLPNGTVGTSYNQTITPSGGTGPYIFSFTGTLPTGLTLSTGPAATATLSGTPTAFGTFNFTVKATDASTCMGTQAYSITINAPPTIGAVGVSRQQGSPVSNSTIANVNDDDQTENTLAVTVNGGASATVNGVTVSGISVSAAGVVTASVVASCTATNASFTLTVTDAASATASATLNVTVTGNTAPTLTYNNQSVAAGGSLTVNPATGLSDNGSINTVVVQSQGAYSGTISVNSSGVVSVSNAKPGGAHTITIRATDNCGAFTDASFTLTINCPAISLSPTTLPNGTVGASYNQTITASGGAAPYSFSISAGTQPTGLSLSAAGVLSGTPSAGGTFNFTVQATDTNGCTGTQAYSVTINTPPTIGAVAVSRQQGSAASNSTIANVNDPDQALNTLAVTVNSGASATVNGVTVSGISVNAAGVVTANVVASCTATNASFTLTVTDSASATANATLNVTVTANTAPTLTYTNQSVAAGGSLAINPATGLSDNGSVSTVVVQGQGLYTGSISVNGSGVVSISNAKPGGVHTITIRATDNCGAFTDASFMLTVNCPAISLSPSTLPNGTAGTFYSQSITASGGTAPYSFTVLSGTPPTGLSLSATGILSGTPSATGTFNFTVQATDANGCAGTQAYSVTINAANNPPTIGAVGVTRQQGSPVSNSTIANVSDADQPSNSLAVTVNGAASATVNGVTVSGISVSAAGVVTANVVASCTATTASFTLTVTDAASATANATLNVTVTANTAPTLSYSNQAVAAGGSLTVNPATGLSDNGTVSTVVVQGQGAYIGTISVNGSGVVSISNAKPGGTHTITIRATDNCGAFTDASFTLTVNCQTISLSPSTLPNGTVGTSYNQTITASGGAAPYGFAVVAGGAPTGLSLSASGVLSGTPSAANTFNFIVQATDANGCTGTQAYSVTINAANNSPTIGAVAVSRQQGSPTSNSTIANVNDADQTEDTLAVTVNGGASATVNGVTVSGISVSAAGVVTANVVASCTATTASFTLTVTDNASATANATLNVTVTANSAPTLTYSNQSVAAGGSLTINPATGLSDNGSVSTVVVQSQGTYTGMIGVNGSGVVSISGAKPGGTHTITIRATDNCGAFTDAQFTLTVNCPAITISPTTLPNGTANTAYNQTLAASGGSAPYGFSISAGALPGGMGLTSGGVLSGTPTTFGTFNFTAKATDANGCMGAQAYTLVINPECGTITIAPATLPNGFTSAAYNQTLTGGGGTSPYSFTVSAGMLPGGLSLSTGGAISGTPTATGTFNFMIKATDVNGCMGTQAYTVIISGNGLQFFPLPTPVRLLETRAGFSGCTNPGTPINAGSTFTLPARTACAGIPAGAAAVTGNVTVVPSGAGFLTLFPSNASQPTVANSNFKVGEITNNVFTVGVGPADGAFKIFSSATTEVIIDVTGYYAPPGTGGLYFHSLPTPIRLLETRAGFTGCFAPGAPLTGTGDPNADPNLDLAVQGRSPLPCGAPIPATAQVLVGNATTVLPSGGGYLTIYPSGGTRPTVASSNYAGSGVINGPFAAKLGADGKFKVYTFATTHLVIDILGYYSADATDVNGAGLLFNPLAHPVRLLETRPDFPGFPLTGCFRTNAPIPGGTAGTRTQPAWGTCDGLTIPNTSRSIIGNVTVINPVAAGFLTFYPGDVATAPTVAISNYPFPVVFGYNRHYFVGLSPADGTFKILTQSTTDLIVDVSGYFAP